MRLIVLRGALLVALGLGLAACTSGNVEPDRGVVLDGPAVHWDAVVPDGGVVADGKTILPVPDGPVGPLPDTGTTVKKDSGTTVKKDSGTTVKKDSYVPPQPDAGSPPPPPPPGDIKVAAVQYGPESYTHVSGCSDTNCGLIHFIQQAAKNGATWIVTPESVPDQGKYAIFEPSIGDYPIGHPNWQGTILEVWAKLAKSVKANLVFNVVAQEGSGTTAKLYNENLVVSDAGYVIGRHRKYHLYSSEKTSLTAGEQCVETVDTPAGKAGLLICADVQCVFCLTSGVSCSSCIAKDKTCLPAYQAAGLHITFFSSYWMATGSSNPVWKATTAWGIFAKYSKTYMVAANTIGGSSDQYHGGGVYKPDGTPIQLYDSKVPGVAYGTIPKAGTTPPPPPPTGDVVITEFMANPAKVSDSSGEWLELYNAGSSTVDLAGWSVRDLGGQTGVISQSLKVPAGGYVVLGVNGSSATNGGVPVDQEISGFSLTNTSDEIILYDSGNNEVDRVEYGSGWSISSGASLSLKKPSLDNNVSSNWCTESSSWSGSAGDKGTPGAPAGC